MFRGPAATGETLGEMVGEGNEGTEGNGASAFPVHLGTGKPVWLLHLILCAWSLPPAMQSPIPAPTRPPMALPLHLETPLRCAGPKPHPHTLTQGPTSKLPNSTLRICCLSPSVQDLNRGLASRLNVAWPRPCLRLKRHPPNPPRSCLTLNPAPA